MSTKPLDIVAFDLDGTILNDQKQISTNDMSTLTHLNEKGILRVVATGRNYFSLMKILPPDFPADYAVFSSGAGIMDWNSKQILYAKHIDEIELKKVIDIMITYKLNFSIHMPIPNNHHLLLYAPHPMAGDLINYSSFYKDFVYPFDPENIPKKATQIIALLNGHVNLFNELQQILNFVKTILTTSPINNKSMWLEIFHKSVSKANGLIWLCNYLKMENAITMGIGNDYNDCDLLNYTNYSFVVNNAPFELKETYNSVTSNNESGFTEAVESIINF